MKNFFMRLLRISETAAIMCSAVAVLFFILSAIGVGVIMLFFEPFDILFFMIGLLSGCLLTILKIFMMEKTLNKALDMEKANAKNYAAFQTILRNLLTLAVLVAVAFLTRVFGLAGIVAGIITMQISGYVTGAIIRKR